MKKTLTVNLGGTVFNIDEDAYRLLDNYLINLKQHFRKDAGADEIVADIEQRVSELLGEKLSARGSQVICLEDVEEVIARVGKPEEMDADKEEEATSSRTGGQGPRPSHRLYRNPDDKLLGGVISGLAVYLGWNVTVCRLVFAVILLVGIKIMVPAYIIAWIVIPEARTAAQKLSMRGEAVTVENIGKTVTDGFEGGAGKESADAGQPRTLLDRIGRLLMVVVKAVLVILAVVCSPILLVFVLVFVALLLAGVGVALGGGAALMTVFPQLMLPDWTLMFDPFLGIVMGIACILLTGIPLLALIFAILRPLCDWQPMNSGLKWTLICLWVASVIVLCLSLASLDLSVPELLQQWEA